MEPLWGCTADLQDAYFHVAMGWAFHKFLAFKVDDRVFVFQFMPFGLSVAPWAFHRVIKPVKAHFHRRSIQIHSYLDDFLLLHPTRVGLVHNTDYVLSSFKRLGLSVNSAKSSLTPSREVVYLGVLLRLDRQTMEIPTGTAQIISLCNETLSRSHLPRRRLESLLGLLNFAAPLVPLGRLRLRPLIMWVNRHTSPSSRDLHVPLDDSFKVMLRVWSTTSFLSQAVPLSVPVPHLQLMTDASLSGWSGIVLPHRVSGRWPVEFLGHSINWLELQAVFQALQHFLSLLRGQCPHLVRQHDGCLVLAAPGDIAFRSFDGSLSAGLRVLPHPLHPSSSQVPSGLSERYGGLRFTPSSGSDRVGAGWRDFPVVVFTRRPVRDRSVCNEGQCEASGLCLPLPRSFSFGGECCPYIGTGGI